MKFNNNISDSKQMFLWLKNIIVPATAIFISSVLPEEIAKFVESLNIIQRIMCYLGIYIIVLLIYWIIKKLLFSKEEKKETESSEEKELLISAYMNCDTVITDRTARIGNGKYPIHDMLIGDPLDCIQKIINAVYETFDNYYGKGDNSDETIKFEATFMTLSYKDNKITIPASKNRESRTPTSMQLREKNINIYDNTVTAQIYKETRPSIHIIEDTTDPKSEYAMLYEKQKDRIQSSVVYPVLSNDFSLLGTLVVHCDKKRFFRCEKKKFYEQLFEIFAKRIAHEKEYLDKLVENGKIQTIDLYELKDIF